MNGISLIVFILERGRSNELFRLCRREGITFTAVAHGRGTASREILNLLGLGSAEKDVALIAASRERAGAVMDTLSDKLGLDRPGVGIAFSIPLAAAANQLDSISVLAGGEPGEQTGRKKRHSAKADGR